jgi:quercetin dioxygenase-like cupin family protein
METITIGGLTLEFLESKEETAGSLDLFRMTVQPNAKVPVPHYHQDWEETVYGLSGVLTFRVDAKDRRVEPGHSLHIPRGAVHWFVNETQEPATCLCVLTPGVLGPGYFREMAEALNAGPPDPAVLKEIMTRHGLVPVPIPG